MGEYQYFEFAAIDRPLTAAEQRELRRVSTRGEISATSFVNEYEWGDFKGDPNVWMARYFDAHLYYANWGFRHVALRLPLSVLDPATAARYCRGEAATSWATTTHVIVDLAIDDEEGDYDEFDPEDWLSEITPVRTELAAGDFRSLYLGWLRVVQERALDGAELEPPVPAGLGGLTAAQRALVDFLRIDADLLRAAAQGDDQTAAPRLRAVRELLAAESA
ncbi:hypothetical protein GCM10010172_16140 [Paractinoplanes ferrugineus]|uniref:Uncharacterized protein n=1 Tax=Paractinoplanes ferrugineus TaxID=113564 RepID=A0A919IXT3_9ACTN|nr:hypothetical protein [Actinoplanes ferrugineus]GIE10178.1 hypothetical protein Afe05nite_20180 [Actinoplanes ferrugineus]